MKLTSSNQPRGGGAGGASPSSASDGSPTHPCQHQITNSSNPASPLTPLTPLTPPPSSSHKPLRDSSWLELEVCRDYLRMSCPRTADQCRFAHIEPNVQNKDGKVTCCYDFLKDRCNRERCKYFHPPFHIKERLLMAGKQFGMMMSSSYMLTGASVPPAMVPATGAQTPLVICYTPLSSPQYPAGVPPYPVPVMGARGMEGFGPAAPVISPYGLMSDQLYICPEFLRGQCGATLCPFVHPEPHIRQNPNFTVTVCKDFVRGECIREHCHYCHPPTHILVQMEAMPGLVMPPQPIPIPMSLGPTLGPRGTPPMLIPVHPPILGLPTPSPTSPSHVPFFPVPPVVGYRGIPPVCIPPAAFFPPPQLSPVQEITSSAVGFETPPSSPLYSQPTAAYSHPVFNGQGDTEVENGAYPIPPEQQNRA